MPTQRSAGLEFQAKRLAASARPSVPARYAPCVPPRGRFHTTALVDRERQQRGGRAAEQHEPQLVVWQTGEDVFAEAGLPSASTRRGAVTPPRRVRMPAIMTGKASGSSGHEHRRRGVMPPRARPALRRSSRRARYVFRSTGSWHSASATPRQDPSAENVPNALSSRRDAEQQRVEHRKQASPVMVCTTPKPIKCRAIFSDARRERQRQADASRAPARSADGDVPPRYREAREGSAICGCITRRPARRQCLQLPA